MNTLATGTLTSRAGMPSPGLPSARLVAPRRSARAVLQGRRVDRWLWRLPLITSTFVSKLAVPPFGALGLSIAIPVLVAASCVGAATGRLIVDTHRLLAYTAMLALLWGFQLGHEGLYSVLSMLLLSALHLPYVFQLRRAPDPQAVLGWFQRVALLIAGLGLLQYSAQFALGPALAFPIENYFPEAFRVSAFNMQGYVEYGSAVYRANGVFMLEPSFFSQLVAIGVVVELITRRRPWAITMLSAALLIAYAGTGIALLVICLLFLAVAQARWRLLGGLAVAGAVLVASAGLLENVPYVGALLSRATEFTAEGSSGFARFVGGFYLFDQYLWDDPVRALTGFGAGSFQVYSERARYPATGMAVFKMVFEFGLVGAAGYFLFLGGCIVRTTAPGVLRLAVALPYVLSGNYIPFAHGLALGLLIWTMPMRPAGWPASNDAGDAGDVTTDAATDATTDTGTDPHADTGRGSAHAVTAA